MQAVQPVFIKAFLYTALHSFTFIIAHIPKNSSKSMHQMKYYQICPLNLPYSTVPTVSITCRIMSGSEKSFTKKLSFCS